MNLDDGWRSDQLIIQRCLNGDISAFRELYDEHKDRLFNIAMRIHGNVQEAEDVLQETFVRIYRALPGFKGTCKLSTWLYRILLNTSFSSLKRKKSHEKKLEGYLQDQSTQSMESRENPAIHVILEQEIGSLPPGYRSVFVLHEVEGFSHEEIGDMLEISAGTSKSQLFKAKKILQKRLKPFLT